MRIKIFPFIKKDNHSNDFFRLLADHSNDSLLRRIGHGKYEKLVK